MEIIFVDDVSNLKEKNITKEEIDFILLLLSKTKFGSIIIKIKNGKIDTIEKEEKLKLK